MNFIYLRVDYYFNTMKKLIALCSVLMLMCVSAHTADARKFGVKAGANVTSLDFKSGMPPTLGYMAGITWQFDLPLGFSIQPDLLYHVKASRISEITKDTFGLGYIEVPVNVQWGLNLANRKIRVFTQASPFLGYAVTQTGSVNPYRTGNEVADAMLESSGLDKWTNINRFSYGAGFGFGVQLWGLQLTAQYIWNFGKLSTLKDLSISKFNDTNFGGYNVTLAVMFGKKK